MDRDKPGRKWIGTAIVYSLSTTLAGLVTGVLLGAIGSFLSFETSLAVASLLGVSAVFVGILELGGRRVRLPQCNRETPQRWVRSGPFRWAMRNGLALGLGAMSRIGFWLWYAVPAGALLSGAPELGATVYGTYGFVRGVGVWGIILLGDYTTGSDVSDRLFEHIKTAKTLAAGQLIFLGIVVSIVIGV